MIWFLSARRPPPVHQLLLLLVAVAVVVTIVLPMAVAVLLPVFVCVRVARGWRGADQVLVDLHSVAGAIVLILRGGDS